MGISGLLEPIEKALNVNLSVEAFEVQGKLSGEVDTGLGFKIPVNMKVSSWFQGDAVGVLLEGLGNLAIVAAHFPPTGALSVYLMTNEKPIVMNRKMTLRQVVSANRDQIRSVLYQKYGKWNKINHHNLPV